MDFSKPSYLFHGIFLTDYSTLLLKKNQLMRDKVRMVIRIREGVEFPFGEGNGNPLQCSCLENPRDGGSLVGCPQWGCSELDTTEAT